MIYFITCRRLNVVKIGFAATDANDRLRILRTYCPYPADMEAIMPGGRADEAALHQRFKAHRTNSEWFEITADIEALIAAHAVPKKKPYDYFRLPRFGSDTPVGKLRTDLRLKQTDLAKMLGVTTSRLSVIERGGHAPEGFDEKLAEVRAQLTVEDSELRKAKARLS